MVRVSVTVGTWLSSVPRKQQDRKQTSNSAFPNSFLIQAVPECLQSVMGLCRHHKHFTYTSLSPHGPKI